MANINNSTASIYDYYLLLLEFEWLFQYFLVDFLDIDKSLKCVHRPLQRRRFCHVSHFMSVQFVISLSLYIYISV